MLVGPLALSPQVSLAQLIPSLDWTEANTVMEAGVMGSKLGSRVSGAGDINGDGYSELITAAPGYEGKGAAFIFYGSSNNLTNANRDVLTRASSPAKFGDDAAGAGDVNGDGFADVIVASLSGDTVYVYHGGPSGVGSEPVTKLPIPLALQDYPAPKISGAGDINGDGYSDIVVAAEDFEDPEAGKGAIFIFHGSPDGVVVTPAAIIKGGSHQMSSSLTVAGAGDVNGDGYSDIIVGTRQTNMPFDPNGKVFTFHGSSAGLITTPAEVVENVSGTQRFGISVAGAGDVNADGFGDVAIVTYIDDSDPGLGSARVYIHHGSHVGINPVAATFYDWTTNSTSLSVSGAGDFNGDGYSDVIAGGGAYSLYEPVQTAQVLLPGSPTGIDTSGKTLTILYWNMVYGQSVAGVGDVNGDGLADIALGAPMSEGWEQLGGMAAIFNGIPTPKVSEKPDQTVQTSPPAYVGTFTVSAGDVNGDGFGDILSQDGKVDQNIVHVFHGSASGLVTPMALTISRPGPSSYFGKSMGSAGDVNGDGYGDVIVGAFGFTSNVGNEGAAYIYYGSSAGLVTGTSTFLTCDKPSAAFGTNVSSAGDLNGDGYSDILVGAPGYSNGQSTEGAIFVYLGSPAGLSTSPTLLFESNKANAWLGVVSGAGDINGDGFSDFVAGASEYTNGQAKEGALYIFYGNATGVSTAPVIIEGNAAGAGLGRNAYGAGDINGDGFNDVTAGGKVYYGSATGLKPSTSEGGIPAGDVNGDGYSDAFFWAGELHYGSPTGLGTDSYFPSFGRPQRQGGDINGDGFTDLLLDHPTYSNGASATGAIFVFYGNRGGISRQLRFFNASSTNPLSQGNVAGDQFGIGFLAKSPDGRNKGKLVWETRKEGQPFSSASPISNSTQYTGIQDTFTEMTGTGAQLTQDIQKAGFNTKVRVRVKYDLVRSLYGQVYGPWTYPQGVLGTQATVPLPVELKYFTATANSEGNVKLTWETASETENESFTIERSPDARNWKELKTIPGGGNSVNALFYQETDPEPYSGICYYRLRQNDFDGKATWSAMRSVSFGARESDQFLYPNPAISTVTVRSDAADFSITDIGGRNVGAGIRFLEKREGFVLIDVSRLPSGVYFVQSGRGVTKLYVR
jgi:hypothetical protein